MFPIEAHQVSVFLTFSKAVQTFLRTWTPCICWRCMFTEYNISSSKRSLLWQRQSLHIRAVQHEKTWSLSTIKHPGDVHPAFCWQMESNISAIFQSQTMTTLVQSCIDSVLLLGEDLDGLGLSIGPIDMPHRQLLPPDFVRLWKHHSMGLMDPLWGNWQLRSDSPVTNRQQEISLHHIGCCWGSILIPTSGWGADLQNCHLQVVFHL